MRAHRPGPRGGAGALVVSLAGARSLAPLFFRSWQRASIPRASVAIIAAGLVPIVPATLLLMLRMFVLQQAPLKTTTELGLAFGVVLGAVVTTASVAGLTVAVRVLANNTRTRS